MSRLAVEIANPVPGGMRFTRRPEHFINAGLAVMDRGKLRFHETYHKEVEQIRTDSDVHYWNGSSRRKGAMYLPGQVRC